MEARIIEQCVDRFGTDIYRFCRHLCDDPAEAEDLYQQTFLKALESDIELNWDQNPKALFFSLAHNLFKSSVRKRARRLSITPNSAIDETEAAHIRSDEDIEDDYLRRELLSEINRIIESLPEKFRLPMTLYYTFDLPVEEIAEAVGKPPGTIKSRLFKGRKLIRKKLKEAGYDE